MITPMTVMPPNLPSRAASSMYTQPEVTSIIRVHNARGITKSSGIFKTPDDSRN